MEARPDRTKIIESFDGDSFFLSNFAESPFVFQGKSYATVEHAYQAAKVQSPENHEKVRIALTPAQSKILGRELADRDDWHEVKLRTMETFLFLKFRQNPCLKQELFDTGEAELQEGNTWGDHYWGICGGKGENHLGRLLMQVRDTLRGEGNSN